MATIDFTDSINDAQLGNQDAIKFIYDNTIQLFHKEANAFLRDKAAADRAIRDAYVFIFDHLSSLEDPTKFLLWANEVCKNTCISMLSDAGVFDERIPAVAINLGEISAAADYDAQINMNANMSPDYVQECLESILSSLPDNQRACAILWGEGYPIRSISRKLGISPVAVNYTLAYTLGNITNSVNALSANGLPLFSMEPIPYFLWLLMNYYQYYQPGDAVPGSESSFSNILRVLMPGEASVFSAGIYNQNQDIGFDSMNQPEPIQVSSSRTSEPDTSFSDFQGDELDISAFIRPETSRTAPFGQAGKESPSDSPAASEESTDSPEVIVFNPHKNEPQEEEVSEEKPADSSAKEESEESAGANEEAGTKAAEEAAQPSETGDAAEAEKASETAQSPSAEGDAVPKTAEPATQSGSTEAAGQTAADQTDHDKMVDDILFGTLAQAGTANEKPKKRTGLIVTLIIIIVILCLLIAAMFLFKDQVNKLLGMNLFNTTQSTQPETTTPAVEEPSTEPTTTEAPTTQEPTTPEPTTEEPTTEEPTTVDPGPEFDVTINLGDSALAMHATPTNDEERLLYIPAGEQVHISEVQDGWGHTSYDGEDGWIWLEYTKVAGNARVQQPEEGTMLEQPEPYVMGMTEFGNELRMLPGSYSASFGPIPEGTEIMIEAYWEDTWAHSMYAYTSYDGHHGWVYLYSTGDTQESEDF